MALLQFYGKDIHSGNKTTIVRWRLSACTIMWLFILAFLSHPVLAEDAGGYGPVQFTRSTGKPERIQQTVAVTNPAASYLLRIVNGGQQGTAQTGKAVSSGTVYWNGSWIAGPSNFNQKITTLTVPVIAHAANTLTVELQGKPGSSITVQLLRGNQAPLAHASNDQTLYVGDVAKLDGSTSTDGNGDALSYRWRITDKPANSLSQLSDTTAMRPEWPIDAYGHYQAELIVNDGFVDSVPDTVAIDNLDDHHNAHCAVE